MTPFAQLGALQKSGSKLFSTGNEWADLGVELAAGSNPVSGVPFYGARAVDDVGSSVGKAFKGDFKGAIGSLGSAAGNVFWGGASFIPGAILGKGALKGGAKVVAKNPGMVGKAVNAVKTPLMQARTAAGTAVNTAAQGTGTMARGAQDLQRYGNVIQRGQNFAGKQMDAVGSRVANWKVPGMKQPLGQQRGKKLVGTSGLIAGGAVVPTGEAVPTAPPAQQPVQPTQPAAPDWYTAATGNTTVPQF
jgi:hypothetical protein